MVQWILKIESSTVAATQHTATSFSVVAVTESLILLGLYTEKAGEGAMVCSRQVVAQRVACLWRNSM